MERTSTLAKQHPLKWLWTERNLHHPYPDKLQWVEVEVLTNSQHLPHMKRSPEAMTTEYLLIPERHLTKHYRVLQGVEMDTPTMGSPGLVVLREEAEERLEECVVGVVDIAVLETSMAILCRLRTLSARCHLQG